MGSDDACKLPRLALGLGFGFDQNDQQIFNNKDKQDKEKNGMVLKFDHVLPCLSLGSPALPPGDRGSSVSPGSSDSNSSTVKREKANGDDLLDGVDKAVSSRASDDDEEGSPRKKLRLTKEQSAVLEDSFKEHNTLNPNQKQALARQLNLRPRQVEVWFQNRRARTKLKQTEMDCELLKKCCENLTEENKRLQRELQDLRALKLPSPGNSPIPAIFMQMPAATLTICPSCERLNAGGGRGSGTGAGAGSGDNGIKGPICNPFDRSAAC